MKKIIGNVKRMISILQAAVLLAASLPQTGVCIYAAEQETAMAEEDHPGDVPIETASVCEEDPQTVASPEAEELSDMWNTGTEAGREELSQEVNGTEEEDFPQTEGIPEEETASQAEDSPEGETAAQTEDVPDMEDSSLEEQESEESETGEEEDTETELASEEIALTADGDYLVYDDSIQNLTVTPGSYHASIEAEMRVNTNRKFCVIYTTKDASQNDFFPGQDSLTDSAIASQSVLLKEGYNCEELDYTPHLGSGGQYYDSWTADFSGKSAFDYYAPGGLTPETTYRYRIAYCNTYASTTTYRFMTVPLEFTTKAAVEVTAVSIKDVSVDEIGYAAARISWTVDNPESEFIADTFITEGEQEYIIYPEEVGPCLDEKGYVLPGRYYALITTRGSEQDYNLKLKVYIGTEKEQQTITAQEAIHIAPCTLSDNEATFDISTSTSVFRASVNINPWYDVDASHIRKGFKIGSMNAYLYYRVRGAASWQSVSQNIVQSPVDLLIKDLSADTTYEYYVTVVSRGTIWNMGSKEEPLTFTTTQRVIYEDSDFPDDVLRGYIKQQLEISSSSRITSDKLDMLTYLAFSNNYPNANYPDQYKGTGVIRSLEGIQYMKNLTNISLYNHAIADAGIISSLNGLKYVDLQLNDLTELPDLSGLPLLQSAKFEANKITADSITADKLPGAFLENNPGWISSTAKSQLSAANTPTQEEIIKKYAEIPWSLTTPNTYSVQPSVTAPFAAGQLSDATINNGLNMLNFTRYVAGIGNNVVLYEEYQKYAQALALVNAVNQELSHWPRRPSAAGFPDDLYSMGAQAGMNCSIAVGVSTLPYSMLMWLRDEDAGNVSIVGHRRGALDPTLGHTAFGAVKNNSTFYAMYVQSVGSTSRTKGTISDYVAWPARNMPTQFMSGNNYPWSISLGTDYYLTDESAVTVTLKNTGTGKTWTFNNKNTDVNGDYFHIDKGETWGLFQCIVFRPKPGDDVSYKAGTRYEVSVTGLTDRAGDAKPLSYTVEFFSLPDSAIVEATDIKLDKTALNMQPGQTEKLTATITPADVTKKDLIWSSSNMAVADVDQEGTVTAVAPGEAVVMATTVNGKKASCKITVKEYTLDRTELNFNLAEGVRTETLILSDGINPVKNAVWSSSDESVAIVSANEAGGGVVTPTGSGNALIWVRITDGPMLSCAVTVRNDRLTAISLSAEKCTMEAGSARKLNVYVIPKDTTLSMDIVWSSDNPTVVSVEDGLVCAISKGSATVTASVGDCTADCVVTVYEKAEASLERKK